MSNDTEINDRERRVKEIVRQLENEDLSLAEATELRDEAHDHLDALRNLVDGSDGVIHEIDRDQ
jgi:exonuclease VII small subunit